VAGKKQDAAPLPARLVKALLSLDVGRRQHLFAGIRPEFDQLEQHRAEMREHRLDERLPVAQRTAGKRERQVLERDAAAGAVDDVRHPPEAAAQRANGRHRHHAHDHADAERHQPFEPVAAVGQETAHAASPPARRRRASLSRSCIHDMNKAGSIET
jgi:hypothetical protein